MNGPVALDINGGKWIKRNKVDQNGLNLMDQTDDLINGLKALNFFLDIISVCLINISYTLCVNKHCNH